MNRSDAPKKQSVPFAINGPRENLLPNTPSGDNTASYDQGFPPITMILKAAGGLPPKGQDMNQILFELSALGRWASSGAINTYDAAFASEIGGYPSGAVVLGANGHRYLSLSDSNTSNPDTSSAGWFNLTTGYLKTANNLSEIKSSGTQADARLNLGLGALATKDSLTASDVGAITQNQADGRYVSLSGSIMTGDLSTPNLTAGTVTATNGTMSIRALFDGTNQYSRLYFVSADGKIVFAGLEADFGRNLVFNINGRRFVMDKDGNMFVPAGVYDVGGRVYSPANKPNAQDVGALPIGGGTLTGPLLVNGQISTSAGYSLYAAKDVVAGGGGVYEGNTRVYSPNNKPTASDVGALSIGGGTLNGPLLVNGQISSGAGFNVYAGANIIAGSGVYEAGTRVYSPNNPQPIPAKTIASLGSTGWSRNLDTGEITQWGVLTTKSTVVEAENFPIQFPNTCISVTGGMGALSAGMPLINYQPLNNFSFNYKASNASLGAWWIARGY